MSKRTSTITWAALLLLVAAGGAGPLAWMVVRSAAQGDAIAALGAPQTWALLGRTAALAGTVAMISTLIGTALGYRLGARRWPGKTLVRTLLLLPIAIPPYLHGIGWTTLLRPDGVAAGLIARACGTTPTEVAAAFYGVGGAVLVLTAAYFPVAALLTEKALAWSSPTLVEAAQVCGAGRWRTLLAAHGPALRPTVVSAAMITFLLASSDLGVPTLLKVRVFNTEVFTQLSAFNDTAAATLLALPLVAVGLVVVRIERRITLGNEAHAEMTDLEPPRPATRRECVTNWLLFAGCGAILLGLPIGAVVASGTDAEALRKMATLAAAPAGNSLFYGVAAAVVMTVLAMLLASLLRGGPAWRRRLTDAVVVIGFAVPSTILALALLPLGRTGAVAGLLTPAVLVIVALVVRYLIIAHRIVGGSLAQMPADLFEAAAVAGAGPWQRTWHVLLPMLRLPLLAALCATFVLSLAEVGSTILLYPPGGETLLIALLSIEANSPRAYVGALTLLQLLPAVLVVGAAGAICMLRRERPAVA